MNYSVLKWYITDCEYFNRKNLKQPSIKHWSYPKFEKDLFEHHSPSNQSVMNDILCLVKSNFNTNKYFWTAKIRLLRIFVIWIRLSRIQMCNWKNSVTHLKSHVNRKLKRKLKNETYFFRKSFKDSKSVFFYSSRKTEGVLFFIYIAIYYYYIYIYIYKKLRHSNFCR